MSLESSIFDALKTSVSNRVYPDVAPLGTVTPYITYQQVGGVAPSFLESVFIGKRNAVIQINCWATTRIAANTLARSSEETVIASTTLRATPMDALMAVDEPDEDPPLYGTHQRFSIWY
jgi:Protein of unknown function (DUF3168)